jgi:hypothetical protein
MTQRQPFLHDLNVLLAAPMQAWSGHDGQIRSWRCPRIYCADTRVVDEAILLVSGEEPEMVGSTWPAAARHPSRPGPDSRRRGSDPLVRPLADTHRNNRKRLGSHPAQLRPFPRHRGRRRDVPNRFFADGGGEIGAASHPVRQRNAVAPGTPPPAESRRRSLHLARLSRRMATGSGCDGNSRSRLTAQRLLAGPSALRTAKLL